MSKDYLKCSKCQVMENLHRPHHRSRSRVRPLGLNPRCHPLHNLYESAYNLLSGHSVPQYDRFDTGLTMSANSIDIKLVRTQSSNQVGSHHDGQTDNIGFECFWLWITLIILKPFAALYPGLDEASSVPICIWLRAIFDKDLHRSSQE